MPLRAVRAAKMRPQDRAHGLNKTALIGMRQSGLRRSYSFGRRVTPEPMYRSGELHQLRPPQPPDTS
jgi:hypothetical protein